MQSTLSIGDKITVSLKSTSGTNLTITHTGMTAEVNGAEHTETGAEIHMGGRPVNISLRVPTAIGVDRKGRAHAIHCWYGKWVGAYHRTVQFCREWEMADGSDLSPEMTVIADAALATCH